VKPGILTGSAAGPLAISAFVALTALLAFLTFGALTDILAQRRALAEASHILTRLQERGADPRSAEAPLPDRPDGSPFLEGPTLTTAGASLMQRVSDAVQKAGGRITSSQVDLGATEAPNGMVSVSASVELEQARLQPLLYDLEAGMPFLFVERLDVRGADASPADGEASMRVQFTVSGRWEGAR
jgi:general secretion pathway protein M